MTIIYFEYSKIYNILLKKSHKCKRKYIHLYSYHFNIQYFILIFILIINFKLYDISYF